jgi:alcohol dehydrogenase class IV
MSCCHYYALADDRECVFSVDMSAISFGPGVLRELGAQARGLGMRRVALFTDQRLVHMEPLQTAADSLNDAGIQPVVYDQVAVEPTDKSFREAVLFAQEGHFDGFVSLGGSSVIDTCKAANLYASYPAELLTYVNQPVGAGQAVPGPLKPHIACPTTCGTGSECTGIAVFDLLERRFKTGIASRRLRPDVALIDPTVTRTLPGPVVAASGFDVLSHALESYTALPFSARQPAVSPTTRPMSQGANPWSDMGCEHALALAGRYLQRAVTDATDDEARSQMMFAATLAGIAFGNAGVHVPHGMSYSVAGMVKSFQPEGYPTQSPIVPHGMSVVVNAPAAFRYTARACPERHLRGAELLGADLRDIGLEDAGPVLADQLLRLMRSTGMPNGLTGVGYGEADLGNLVAGALPQQRLLANAPLPVGAEALEGIYRQALRYW